MKPARLLFLIIVIFLVFGSVYSVTFGVVEPRTVCIKPNRTTDIYVTCGNGENETSIYTVALEGPEFMKLRDSQYLFLPYSYQEIPIWLNTTDVVEGMYTSNFTFSILSPAKDSGLNTQIGITVHVNVNVSENCAELPLISAEKPKLFGCLEFETAKIVFNIAVLFLIFILLILLFRKRIVKKRREK